MDIKPKIADEENQEGSEYFRITNKVCVDTGFLYPDGTPQFFETVYGDPLISVFEVMNKPLAGDIDWPVSRN